MGFRPFRRKNRRQRRREREPRRERESRREREPRREPRARQEEATLQPIPGSVDPQARAEWGPLTRLSDNIRIQARRGHRAAVVELQPGMHIVAEVPEEMVRTQVGVLPLLAPLLMLAANRALKRRMKEERTAEQVVYEPPPPQLMGPSRPAPWVAPEDMQTALSGCGCNQRR